MVLLYEMLQKYYNITFKEIIKQYITEILLNKYLLAFLEVAWDACHDYVDVAMVHQLQQVQMTKEPNSCLEIHQHVCMQAMFPMSCFQPVTKCGRHSFVLFFSWLTWAPLMADLDLKMLMTLLNVPQTVWQSRMPPSNHLSLSPYWVQTCFAA